MPPRARPFWTRTKLAALTREQWESLCDGCARCCLLKLEDEDSGAIAYTDVACRLLDLGSCRCTDYARRRTRVPDCLELSPANLPRVAPWLPASCAYRRLAEGRDLPAWHPLVAGRAQAVHDAGASVQGRVTAEDGAGAGDLEDRIVSWPQDDIS